MSCCWRLHIHALHTHASCTKRAARQPLLCHTSRRRRGVYGVFQAGTPRRKPAEKGGCKIARCRPSIPCLQSETHKQHKRLPHLPRVTAPCRRRPPAEGRVAARPLLSRSSIPCLQQMPTSNTSDTGNTSNCLTCHASPPLAGAGLLHRDEWLGIQPL
jgi:hypothetical protein